MKFQPAELGLLGVMVTGLALFIFFPDPKVRRRGAAFFLAWFVPGLGHVVMKEWKKGIFFFCILSASYIFGLWICGWRTVSFEDNPFYYVGQYGSGMTVMLGHAFGAEKAFPRADLPLTWYDPGLLYVCVAGLLNLVITLGILDIKEKEAAPKAAAKDGEAEEKKEEAKEEPASPATPDPEPKPEGEGA